MPRYVTVKTGAGTLRGVESLGVTAFLGVPYGEADRFLPPEPARAWTGVRDAVTFGPAAPQVDTRVYANGSMPEVLSLMYPRTGTPVEGGPMGEDCLALNVWAPDVEGGPPRPVMVWFHGGGFIHGTGTEMMFNGDRLARSGDVVVVTVNHRLGLFGHLPLDAALGERFAGSGNAGILDLALALEWVRDNISAFGGDPANVTIFGQSGGAGKVATVMAMPRAAGLFHKAIMQSGPITRAATVEDGDRLLDRVLRELDLPRDQAAGLLDISMRDLLDVQTAIFYGEPMRFGAGLFSNAIGVGPILDGEILPIHPFDPGPAAQAADVPLLIGSTVHDAALLLNEDPEYLELTEAGLSTVLRRDLGDQAGETMARYRAEHPGESPRLLWSRIVSDLSFRQGSIAIAERKLMQPAAVYMYLFAQETPILGELLGACHSLDLPYVFNVVDRVPFVGQQADRHRVADAMSRAWATFARTGDPSHEAIPDWPRYSLEERATMVIAGEWRVDRPQA